MKASIEIGGMRFHSYHGCLPDERKNGGEYVVDFSCRREIGRAAQTDCLEDTLDYSRVYDIVAEEMGTASNLLEHVAARIMSAVCSAFPEIEDVTVRVTKLNPPVNGPADSASVTLTR